MKSDALKVTRAGVHDVLMPAIRAVQVASQVEAHEINISFAGTCVANIVFRYFCLTNSQGGYSGPEMAHFRFLHSEVLEWAYKIVTIYPCSADPAYFQLQTALHESVDIFKG